MPRPHQTMRKVREILRLRWSEQLSLRDVATALAMPHATVALYERRALDAGLTWPLPELDDDALEVGPRKKGPRRRARSDPHSRARRTGRPRGASRLPRHASEGDVDTVDDEHACTARCAARRYRLQPALRSGQSRSSRQARRPLDGWRRVGGGPIVLTGARTRAPTTRTTPSARFCGSN